MESEKKTEPYLVKQVKSFKGKCIKMDPTYYAGIPDRLCLMPGGVIFFVETKSEGDKPRPIQLFVHKALRKLGFSVHVADTKLAVRQILKHHGFIVE